MDTDDQPRLHSYAKAWQAHGSDVTWLTGDQVHQYDPLLNPAIEAALYVPHAASIKPPLMTRAYAQAARKLGAQIYEHTEVTGLQHSSGKVTAIHTAQQETITCNRIVIATGAWSAHIGSWLGLTLPVFPARGQILSLKQPSTPLKHTIFGKELYLVPKLDNSIYVGATVEDVGFAKSNTAGGLAWLLSRAIQLNPYHVSAYLERAGTHRALGNHVPAIQDYSEVLRHHPGNVPAYTGRGLAYRLKGDVDRALADYTEEQKEKQKRTQQAVPALVKAARLGVMQRDYQNALDQVELALLYAPDDADALPAIARKSRIPVIADIHFQPKYVFAAIDAGGAAVRVNPGNIKKFDDRVAEIAKAAKDAGIPIRIGVNAGSLDPKILAKYGKATSEALVESALWEASLFAEHDFHDIKISVKHHDPVVMVRAYEQLAAQCDYPLHLGVTEAGPAFQGTIKSATAFGALLSQGIGDTIRVSLSAPPVEEVKVGLQILESLNLRTRRLEIVSCPSCGRAQVDVYKLADEVTAGLEGMDVPLRVAVMGCVVNGPGEAREADLGVASGNGKGQIFVRGKVIKTVPEAQIVETLIEEAFRLAEGS